MMFLLLIILQVPRRVPPKKSNSDESEPGNMLGLKVVNNMLISALGYLDLDGCQAGNPLQNLVAFPWMTFHVTDLQFQLVNSVGGLDISAGIPLLHRVGVTSKGEY